MNESSGGYKWTAIVVRTRNGRRSPRPSNSPPLPPPGWQTFNSQRVASSTNAANSPLTGTRIGCPVYTPSTSITISGCSDGRHAHALAVGMRGK